MKKILLSLFLISCFCQLLSAQNRLDIETIFRGKLNAKGIPGIKMMQTVEGYTQLSDDRKQVVAYSLPSGEQLRVLADVDINTAETIESIDDYKLSPDETKVLLQTNTEMIYRRSFCADFFVYDIKSGTMHSLSVNGKQEAPVWAPDGNRIAFVRENNIFIHDCGTGVEDQITHDGKVNEIINGKPDWVYEEEFGFNVAMAFDASGDFLVWLRFDESEVEMYDLQMYKGLKPSREENALYPSIYAYKYPKAGCKNSKVSVLSYDLRNKTTQPIHVDMPDDGYLPRIKPAAKPHEAFVYTLNRHQDSLAIVNMNLEQSSSKVLLCETAKCYIKEDVYDNLILGKQTILLPSDRDGFMHLYAYDYNGRQVGAITPGQYDITAVYGFDEKHGTVYYQAAALSPCDRQVYASNLKGKIRRLTDRRGWNTATFSSGYSCFVRQWSDRNTPYEYTLCNNQGKPIRVLQDNQQLKSDLASYNLPQRELFSFTTQEGVSLNGWMVRPADFDASKRYPVIMFQYSGPGNQQVVDSWNMGSLGRGALFDCYLAQEGFIVACVDGRGTGGRGADFEKCTYLNLGKLEAHDQVEAALYLASLPYVDAERIGIWGWSYGGFNTLMSMSQDNAFFKTGVAIAPPTDWRFYDSIYTERFMRTPAENPEGYDYNPISLATQLRGSLLLCHGLADDNVHPQNTFEYTEALVQNNIDFKQNLYTNRNHSIYGGNTRLHLMRQIADWFKANLAK